MPELTRDFWYRIDDPAGRGLHASLDSLARIENLTWFRGNSEYIGLKPCKAAAPGSGRVLEPVAQSSISAVRVVVGDADKGPSSGNFSLTITNTSSSAGAFVENIPYNASASTFEAAINAVVGSVVLLPVSVTKSGVDYIITAGSGDAYFSVAPLANNLTPECEIIAKKIRDGNSDVRAIWRVRVVQKGMAYAEPSTAYPTLSSPISATETQAGSNSQVEIQTIDLAPVVPIGGKCKWSFAQRQKVAITCKSDTAGSLNNVILAVLQDTGGDVQIYLTDGGGSPPSAPVPGRQIPISIYSGISAEGVARAVYEQISTDSELYAADVDGAVVSITSGIAGHSLGDAAVSVDRTRSASTVTSVLPYNASESDIETALGGTWDVSIPSPGSWQFTAVEVGPQAAISLVTTGLKIPEGVKGVFDFDTLCAQEAFGTANGNVSTTFGIEITQDSVPRQVVSLPTTVIRDNVQSV